jgi:hypothetical protein
MLLEFYFFLSKILLHEYRVVCVQIAPPAPLAPKALMFASRTISNLTYLQMEFDVMVMVMLYFFKIWWRAKCSNLLISENNTFIYGIFFLSALKSVSDQTKAFE